jgi:HEAT repeat protein
MTIRRRRFRSVRPMLCICAAGLAQYGFGQGDLIDQLITQLKDPNYTVRLAAVRALAETKDPRAGDPLFALRKDPDPAIRGFIDPTLFALNYPGAVDLLISDLTDPNRYARINAASALGGSKDPRAVEPLIGALGDPDYQVRFRTAESLAAIKDPRAVDPLIAALNDSSQSVRMDAARALAAIKDPRAVEPLITTLKVPNSDIQADVVSALGDLGDPRAIAPLIAALAVKVPSDIHDHAATALGKIGPPAVESLIFLLKNTDPQLRRGAAKALGDIDDPRAATVLLDAFHRRDMLIVAGADLFFLGRIDLSSSDDLIQALNQFGDLRMADDFLNSGNQKLEQAGQQWGVTHGFLLGGTAGGRKTLFTP